MLAFLLASGVARPQGANLEVLLRLAEIGLVLLLFTDASRTDLRRVEEHPQPAGPPAEHGDAADHSPRRARRAGRLSSAHHLGSRHPCRHPRADRRRLGQIIVNSPRVPMKIRQALNVEAGLNDGLSVPFLLFFIALAGAGAESHDASLARFIVEQLGFGIARRDRARPGRRLASGPCASPGMDGGIVAAAGRRHAAAPLPDRVRGRGREHVHRGVRRRPGGSGGLQGGGQAQRRVH